MSAEHRARAVRWRHHHMNEARPTVEDVVFVAPRCLDMRSDSDSIHDSSLNPVDRISEMIEKRSFKQVDSDLINGCANQIDPDDGTECMKNKPLRIEKPCVLKRVNPKPLTHRIAVCVNQENAENRLREDVDDRIVFQFEILKEHEKGN